MILQGKLTLTALFVLGQGYFRIKIKSYGLKTPNPFIGLEIEDQHEQFWTIEQGLTVKSSFTTNRLINLATFNAVRRTIR